MNELSWAKITNFVHERAHNCCEYCQTCQKIIGQAMHVEHIQPDGGDGVDNLCLSCANCNLSKAKATTALDTETGEIVPLFNPRTQKWVEHFQWVDNGQRLAGRTKTGRATVERLKINQERIVTSRLLWIEAGYHPPKHLT